MTRSKAVLLIGLIGSLLVNILLFDQIMKKQSSPFAFNQGEVSFAFSQMANDPQALLLQAINRANKTLDIAIYNIEDPKIAQAILDAKERGVRVRVITDASKATKKSQVKILEQFQQYQIEVKVPSSRKMHLKMAIIDEQMIVLGSYNYTEASAYENIEQLLTLSNEELAKEWTILFSKLWTQNELVKWDK
ncbi:MULTISPECIES: phospholipase D-like domain-containing protein [unclassified Lysinibacillus]|uniref:phospholipase D-like domain-containing protein n=1 Tax=unclassified Lysinibacillus TaxID=2636778 RepID=UPI0035D97033